MILFKDLKYNKREEYSSLKNDFLDRLRQLPWEDVSVFKGRLTKTETREWYEYNVSAIKEKLDIEASLESQARDALNLRNDLRFKARELMKDLKDKDSLNEAKPNLSFEEMVIKKWRNKGLLGDDVLRDIIRSASTTNKEVNERYLRNKKND